MRHMTGTFPTPYYAVIFISMKATDDAAFDAMQQEVAGRLRDRRGFLGMDRHRDSEGLGFSISYWDSPESIRAWREEPVHAAAQAAAKEKWYSEYVIRVCAVEHDMSFSRA